MIKIAGHWELSWNAPIKEVELWNFVLREYEVSEWYMWPVSGVKQKEQSVNLYEFDTFREILQEIGDIQKVYLEPINPLFPHDELDLRTFNHPKDVVYIFGSAHFNPILGNKKDNDVSVTIPTIKNSGVLWPHQCLLTVLYDRLTKECQ